MHRQWIDKEEPSRTVKHRRGVENEKKAANFGLGKKIRVRVVEMYIFNNNEKKRKKKKD